MKRLLFTLFPLLLLSGCATAKLGAFCYLPFGVIGACELKQVPSQTTEGEQL